MIVLASWLMNQVRLIIWHRTIFLLGMLIILLLSAFIMSPVFCLASSPLFGSCFMLLKPTFLYFSTDHALSALLLLLYLILFESHLFFYYFLLCHLMMVFFLLHHLLFLMLFLTLKVHLICGRKRREIVLTLHFCDTFWLFDRFFLSTIDRLLCQEHFLVLTFKHLLVLFWLCASWELKHFELLLFFFT